MASTASHPTTIKEVTAPTVILSRCRVVMEGIAFLSGVVFTPANQRRPITLSVRGGVLAGVAVALPLLYIGKSRPILGDAHQAMGLIGVALAIGLARHSGGPFPEIRRLGHLSLQIPTHRIRLSGGF
jgi:hypothetical protein